MAKAIILRRLGKSDLMVSPIGLGCWQFSRQKGLGGKYWPFLEESEILKIVRVSLEGGINWFDTAEAYGMGESERALSEALRKLDKSEDEAIIATKWMPLFRRAKSIIKTIDKRIQSLNNYPIDLYQIHQPLSFSPIKAQMRAMAQLVHERKVLYIGISNFSAKKMRKAHDELSSLGLQLISNQVRYSLLDRRIETNGILDTARELGVSIIAYSPLAQGILSGKFHDNPGLIRKRSGYRKYMGAFRLKGLERSRGVVEALKELAEKYRVTPAQIALNWVINFCGDAVVAIPGATSSTQAMDNTGSMKFKLTADDLHHLDEVSASFKI